MTKNHPIPNKVSSVSWERTPIFLCTVLMNVIVLLGCFFEYPSLGLNNNIGYAVTLHIILFIFYLIGYIFYRNYASYRILKFQKRSPQTVKSGLARRFICMILILFGAYASVETISHAATLQEYLLALMSGLVITRGVEVSSVDGGASGLIKMATYMPLAVFSVYIIAIRQNIQLKISDKLILLCSILAILAKVLFTLDRLTVIYLIVGLLLIREKSSSVIKTLSNISVLVVMVFFVAITALRIDDYNDSVAGSLFLYSRLGLENLQIIMQNGTPLTLGSQTIFNPIVFMADKLSLVPYRIITYEYIWNPAQYFYGHLYMDYGILAAPAIFFYGLFCSYIESKSSASTNRIANALLLPLAINSFTGVGVVWLRGIEFYFVVLLIFLLQIPKKSVKRLKLNEPSNSIKVP